MEGAGKFFLDRVGKSYLWSWKEVTLGAGWAWGAWQNWRR